MLSRITVSFLRPPKGDGSLSFGNPLASQNASTRASTQPFGALRRIDTRVDATLWRPKTHRLGYILGDVEVVLWIEISHNEHHRAGLHRIELQLCISIEMGVDNFLAKISRRKTLVRSASRTPRSPRNSNSFLALETGERFAILIEHGPDCFAKLHSRTSSRASSINMRENLAKFTAHSIRYPIIRDSGTEDRRSVRCETTFASSDGVRFSSRTFRVARFQRYDD